MTKEAAEVDAMSPAQLAAREHKRQTQIPTPPPPKPDGYFLALEAIRAEDKDKEREQREQRERKLGLPRLQNAYDKRADQIGCRARRGGRALPGRPNGPHARERRRRARQLGVRPTLETLEAVA